MIRLNIEGAPLLVLKSVAPGPESELFLLDNKVFSGSSDEPRAPHVIGKLTAMGRLAGRLSRWLQVLPSSSGLLGAAFQHQTEQQARGDQSHGAACSEYCQHHVLLVTVSSQPLRTVHKANHLSSFFLDFFFLIQLMMYIQYIRINYLQTFPLMQQKHPPTTNHKRNMSLVSVLLDSLNITTTADFLCIFYEESLFVHWFIIDLQTKHRSKVTTMIIKVDSSPHSSFSLPPTASASN